MIVFACLAPHPPLLLPDIGSAKDQAEVKRTVESLEQLGEKLKKVDPDQIIISSPHPDWGFKVPLHFLAKDIHGIEVKTYLMDLESPEVHFNRGKELIKSLPRAKRGALIASGDLSHRLKEEGPYGFHPEGPNFDQKLIEFLKKKDSKNFLKLDKMFPEAGECGLRSFSFLLGILEASGISWKPQILSYEGPFGVGYLVADFKLTQS